MSFRKPATDVEQEIVALAAIALADEVSNQTRQRRAHSRGTPSLIEGVSGPASSSKVRTRQHRHPASMNLSHAQVTAGLGEKKGPSLLAESSSMTQVLCSKALLAVEYGTIRSRRPFVFSARMRSMRMEGSISAVQSPHSSSRLNAAS